MTTGSRYVLLLFTLYTCLSSASAQQSRKCGIGNFQCQNGECIAGELLCDGKADCTDKSDETESECTALQIPCSEYTFRCNYGACIDGDLTCNGVSDCIDNSDETLPTCPRPQDPPKSVECSINQFRCDNGQCIDGTALCDGTVDCKDRSDETDLKCGSFNCSQFLFRCTYGACIDGDFKCNNVRDCADGSDEDPKLCYSDTTTTTTSTTTPRIVPLSGTTTTVAPWLSFTCPAPPQPRNGKWELDGCQESCNVNAGEPLNLASSLIYTCDHGYKLSTRTGSTFCTQGGWRNIPTCVEVFCNTLASASISADCIYNNVGVSCEDRIKVGTYARLKCRNSYQEIRRPFSRRSDIVWCNGNGEWDPLPIQCEPVCGYTTSSAKPLIVNGQKANVTEFPWHATLYEETGSDGTKEFICGASIITESVLVTAAHCIWDEANKQTKNPSRFYIATGNSIRDYDYHHPRHVKRRSVIKIYVPCNYLGAEGNYGEDIAILKINEPFTFSAYLMPICLDTLDDRSTVLQVPNTGRVAGFGLTITGNTSGILQYVTLPFVPDNQCKSSTDVQTRKFITRDKFCAGYQNGTSVCDGDSGGGLVFQTGDLYYIRGIVSVSYDQREGNEIEHCDHFSYSLYTHVYSHIKWIDKVILDTKNQGKLDPCISS